MKCFPRLDSAKRIGCGAAVAVLLAAVFLASARGELPNWIRNVESHRGLEAAFFRLMQVPGGAVLYRRPPVESRAVLRGMLKLQPKKAQLYSMLALEDERQLDFAAAETDWKAFVQASSDKVAAEIALADFYQRRLRPQDEIESLAQAAGAPNGSSEKLKPAAGQQSWRAFERIFTVVQQQGLPAKFSDIYYSKWIARYPKEPSVYTRFLDFLISQKQYAAAGQLIQNYRKQFPEDQIFPVKAEALVEYKQGSLPQGLGVYQKSFQPLWNPELVNGYFDLLRQTQGLRKFLDEQRSALSANPEDLKATALVFYYYQQEGKLDAAQAEITQYRLHKESAHSEWTSNELYVCARLLEQIHEYAEAARYYFALYNAKDGEDPQMQALAGLTRVLLDAPETPIRFGSGNLSMYRDIATMDTGPGYLNGILSLILNTTAPASELSEEEQRAVPYFHRSRAAALLQMLDTKFPRSPDRPELHAKLIAYYAGAAKSDAVIRAGKEFFAAFPAAAQRTEVALLMADAYAREGRSEDEFAIYDSVLKELAAKAQGVPLGSGVAGLEGQGTETDYARSDEFGGENPAFNQKAPKGMNSGRPAGSSTLQLADNPVWSQQSGSRSPDYSRVLDRYLARLTELKQIPRAISVLRGEIEHNPDDPGIYERLAVFLEQNRLGVEQEQVYKQAMARFPDRSWYNRLARFYLRRREGEQFAALTQNVVKIFSGTDLEQYFQSVVTGGSPALFVQLNLYAHERFPHNPVFVTNLLEAYQWPQTRNQSAWLALIREHWFEEADLRNQFFAYLSATGRLETEINSLNQGAQAAGGAQKFVRSDPAAGNYLAQADLWQSHYEESAPLLKELAFEYPAEPDLSQTASSVFRSLAYFNEADTNVAVKIEDDLLAATPGDSQLLARIGDTLADRGLFSRAAPYWDRIPQIAPGKPSGYLDAATIYWDYFDFGNALRLLNEARKKFNNDNLFAYEEGAIYEGERMYPRAISEYAKGSLVGGESSPAEERLLQLARRPQYHDFVDKVTQMQAEQTGAPIAAIELRAHVLGILSRKQELQTLLDQAIRQATTLESVGELETLAEQKSLGKVAEHALEKEASLTSDPVSRLQMHYALVRLYERENDRASAQKEIEELYRENPKILGVVRATVDFYWSAKLYPQAIAVLQQAARDAYLQLSKQFTFEAARKSTEAKLYPQAREMLAGLLKDSPYDVQYLAATADTYAQAGDAQGLKQFYVSEIAAFRTATLPADAKKSEVAILRRGLIPALSKLDDYSGAVDQYVELINAFLEDEALATEAALYAAHHHQAPRLVQYYAKTMQQSPRDYRWPMVLARIQSSAEDFPAAVDAYARAIVIRPDREDLRIAEAALEERLMRFDDAAAEYQKIYLLAYKDPQWMEKVAEIRARQGRAAEAMAALKIALIEPKPNRPGSYFEAARRVEGWGLLEQAQGLAEQGVRVAGGDLLASEENHSGAALYAHLMTRLRRGNMAYATLQQALASASARLPVIEQQIAAQGISAVTNSDWRTRVRENRIQSARNGLRAALMEMGTTVATYFTPEEKVWFGQFAQKIRAPMNLTDAQWFAIPLAQAAGLADLEAEWRYQVMLDPGASNGVLIGRMQAYVQLEQRRLKFAELAQHLEQFAPRVAPASQPSVLIQAANAYGSAEDTNDELRVLSELSPGYMYGEQLQRYFELLLQHDPQQLVQIASQWKPWGEKAADFVMANGSPTLAHEIVAGRAATQTAVWSKSYDALTGLYFAESAPQVNAAFLGALGDETIGERIGRKLDRNEELAGSPWSYYGSRYGEYLDLLKQSDAQDFLPSALEQSPASWSGYMQMADYYAEKGKSQAAIADYLHVLELNPSNVTAHDLIAVAQLRLGNRGQALKQWNLAIGLLSKQVQSVSVPESFWGDFAELSNHAGPQRLFAELKPGVDALLRAYLRKNGTYRSNELLQSAYEALHDPPAATAWLLDLSTAASDPPAVLAGVVDSEWIPLAQRAPIYQRILAAKQDAADKAEGLDKDSAVNILRQWQVRWANYLIASNHFEQANTFLTSLPADTRTAYSAQLTPIALRVAAHLGTLDATLASYRLDEQSAPGADTLRETAQQLQKSGDETSSRKILQFVYAREIEERHLDASNFLGLAEIRLANGDAAGAVDLLHRLTMVVGEPFANFKSAAELLNKKGHPAEAAQLLGQLTKAAPWDLPAKVSLAKSRIAAGTNSAAAQQELAEIASDPVAPYGIRVQASLAMAERTVSATLDSRELNLLAAGPQRIIPAAAAENYFYQARISAAHNATNAQAKLQLLGAAIADYPSREGAKYLYFETAARQRDDLLALATLEQLPEFFSSYYRYQPAEDMKSGPVASWEHTESVNEVMAGSSAPALTRERQLQLRLEAAAVLQSLNRLDQSLQQLRIALRLEENPQKQKGIKGRIDAMQKERTRQQQNQARKPILHQALEQDRVVRPRIPLTSTAETEKEAAKP